MAWKSLGVHERVRQLRPLQKIFQDRAEQIAHSITQEMGKPITESRADMTYGMTYLSWFLENAESALSSRITRTNDREHHVVTYEPLGVAAVILPWNFPFDIFLWGVMTNLLAGNTVVIKHSEHCPLTGQLLAHSIQSLGLPEGVFASVDGAGDVGRLLAEDANIDLIWFTGSTMTGRKLLEHGARHLKKVVVEMGGSNPTIVCPGVDLASIVPLVATRRLLNTGQSCSALKRLIVHASMIDELTERLRTIFDSSVIGDPSDPQTTLGPLVSEKQAVLLRSQIDDAVQQGAHIVTGSAPLPGLPSSYVRPTILVNITRSMRVWTEETFGPVLPIVPYTSEQQAIDLAEDTPYGLGAQVYTPNPEQAMRFAHALRVGNVEINGISRRIPCNPFGGCKASGVGREHGIYGFQEVCDIKCLSMPASFAVHL